MVLASKLQRDATHGDATHGGKHTLDAGKITSPLRSVDTTENSNDSLHVEHMKAFCGREDRILNARRARKPFTASEDTANSPSRIFDPKITDRGTTILHKRREECCREAYRETVTARPSPYLEDHSEMLRKIDVAANRRRTCTTSRPKSRQQASVEEEVNHDARSNSSSVQHSSRRILNATNEIAVIQQTISESSFSLDPPSDIHDTTVEYELTTFNGEPITNADGSPIKIHVTELQPQQDRPKYVPKKQTKQPLMLLDLDKIPPPPPPRIDALKSADLDKNSGQNLTEMVKTTNGDIEPTHEELQASKRQQQVLRRTKHTKIVARSTALSKAYKPELERLKIDQVVEKAQGMSKAQKPQEKVAKPGQHSAEAERKVSTLGPTSFESAAHIANPSPATNKSRSVVVSERTVSTLDPRSKSVSPASVSPSKSSSPSQEAQVAFRNMSTPDPTAKTVLSRGDSDPKPQTASAALKSPVSGANNGTVASSALDSLRPATLTLAQRGVSAPGSRHHANALSQLKSHLSSNSVFTTPRLMGDNAKLNTCSNQQASFHSWIDHPTKEQKQDASISEFINWIEHETHHAIHNLAQISEVVENSRITRAKMEPTITPYRGPVSSSNITTQTKAAFVGPAKASGSPAPAKALGSPSPAKASGSPSPAKALGSPSPAIASKSRESEHVASIPLSRASEYLTSDIGTSASPLIHVTPEKRSTGRAAVSLDVTPDSNNDKTTNASTPLNRSVAKYKDVPSSASLTSVTQPVIQEKLGQEWDVITSRKRSMKHRAPVIDLTAMSPSMSKTRKRQETPPEIETQSSTTSQDYSQFSLLLNDEDDETKDEDVTKNKKEKLQERRSRSRSGSRPKSEIDNVFRRRSKSESKKRLQKRKDEDEEERDMTLDDFMDRLYFCFKEWGIVV